MKFKVKNGLKIQQVDTWAATIEDKPGSLASKLEALADAGVNLEFIIARRAPEKPGTGVIFVTPIEGESAIQVAQEAGFHKAENLHAVRLEGPDQPGEGARVARALADRGINLRGLSGAAINNKFVAHVAFDSAEEAAEAAQILGEME